MPKTISRNRFLLLFACLLLSVTTTHAQRESHWSELQRNQAWLNVYIDPYGAAFVTLGLSRDVRDRDQLSRSLVESFSFPLKVSERPAGSFYDDDELDDEATEEEGLARGPWTGISASSPKTFSGGMLQKTCQIDVHPLLSQLEQHQINSLKVLVIFRNGSQSVEIKGAQRLATGSVDIDRYEADVDVHDGNFPVLHFAMGYSAGELLKKSIPLILFLLLPALWTTFSARRRTANPEELWGRHLRFLHRLLNVVWLVWLPMYFLLGLSEIISFVFEDNHRAVAQLVNVASYFIPPVIAMFLCHFASHRVYEQVLSVDWSPRRVVRQAVIANTLSLIPIFFVIAGMFTFVRSPRQAALYVIVGYVGLILLSQNMARLLGSRLHALTSGDLRNRIFDLAHRAGVKLRQVYVLPETNAQLSNAFARSDNCVMITNSLLKNLSRREVDAIMAHEIGHLQAKHPQSAGMIMVAVIVAANFVGTGITSFANLQNATPFVFAAAIGLANLAVFLRSRRNERQADAIGITLTGDPEASISGLAKLSRLNLMPLHSGGWGKSLDTHPAAMRRFEEIAKAHGISESRLQELVTDAAVPQEMYPAIDDDVDTTVFSSEFRNKYRVRVALTVLAVLLLAPVPFAAAMARDEVSALGMLGLAIGGIIWSFGVSLVVRNRSAFWGYHSLGLRLRMKLDKRGLGEAARQGTLLGLAPAAESRRYEHYPFWDIGVLWLTNEKLFYIGEQCEFALARDQINEVYTRDNTPEWLAEKNLFLRWKDYSEGPTKTLHFVATGASSVLQSRRAIDSLQQRVQAWMYQSASFLPCPPALKWMSAPVFPEITSEPALMNFNIGFVFKAAVRLSIFAAVVAFALRLSYTGIAYMTVALFALTFVDELSRVLKNKQRTTPVIPQPASFEAGTYQAGSWKNA